MEIKTHLRPDIFKQIFFNSSSSRQCSLFSHIQDDSTSPSWRGVAARAKAGSVDLARAFARQQGMDLSVGSTKTLLHNAVMVDRFIAMSGKTPNMRLNNTDFKELIFYGVRAAV